LRVAAVNLSPDQVAAVVLAGGFGTRIQHLLTNLPKPMAPVGGKPFVEWVVRYLARQGIRRVIISTGYLAETVDRHFQAQPVRGVAVRCVPETTPLGTGGGFCHAIEVSAEKPAAWLVVNGDSLALAPLAGMFRTLTGPGVEGVILGVPMADASRYGTIGLDAEGGLASFNEKKPGAGIINAGAYLFRTSAIDTFPERRPLSFETEVFPALTARQARLKVCVAQAPFLDIGTPDSLSLAETFIREHRADFLSD
jgi:D-glycero-alpha-D-manno-heptose 1-phosphate guanylyltransferase